MNGLKVFTKIENKFEALKSIKNISSAWVCVTDGENGVYYLKDNKLENIPAKKITVKDTLGAGDVWHGAFALSLAEGNDEVNAIKFASLTTLKCKFFGGRDGFPNRQQVDQFLMGINNATKPWQQGMKRLSDKNGIFKMTAVDQRPPIKKPIAEFLKTQEAPWVEVANLKSAIESLQDSSSALLLIPHLLFHLLWIFLTLKGW